MSGTMNKNELQEGLEIIEVTNLKYFTKEMTAEFYALKGTFLAQIGRRLVGASNLPLDWYSHRKQSDK